MGKRKTASSSTPAGEAMVDQKPPLPVTRVPIDSLKPDPNNARKHGERNVKIVTESLRKFGQQRAILVGTDHVIRAGNCTWSCAKSLGWKFIDVCVSDLKDAELEAYALADNNSVEYSEWDEAALKRAMERLNAVDPKLIAAAGWTDAEVKKIRAQSFVDDTVPGAEMDRAKEFAEKWKVKPGDLFEIPSKSNPKVSHFAMCGDSTSRADVMKVSRGNEIDFIVTSPPYNVGVEYASHDDKSKAWAVYRDFLVRILTAWLPSLAQGRFVAWNIGTSPQTYSGRQYVMLEDVGLLYQRTMIWKKIGVPVPLFFNTRDNPVARQFTPNYTHEIVLLFTKGEIVKGQKVEFGEDLQHDVFEVHQSDATRDMPDNPAAGRTGAQSNLETRSNKAHPAAFPVAVPELFARHLSDVGAVVADPFLGSGSTILAAERSMRSGIGLEIDPGYTGVVLERLATAGLEPRKVK